MRLVLSKLISRNICYMTVNLKIVRNTRNLRAGFLNLFVKVRGIRIELISRNFWKIINYLTKIRSLCSSQWWKVLENAITSKIFCEINSLVTSLVKTLIWRNKCWFSTKIVIAFYIFVFVYVRVDFTEVSPFCSLKNPKNHSPVQVSRSQPTFLPVS